jgi:hypothetical protein
MPLAPTRHVVPAVLPHGPQEALAHLSWLVTSRVVLTSVKSSHPALKSFLLVMPARLECVQSPTFTKVGSETQTKSPAAWGPSLEELLGMLGEWGVG